jgi:energy-coupling factor transport system ATP-binding protein
MIKARNLSVSFGNTRILEDINLEINKGEFVLITGPSGCGKSTLALALSGLIPQSKPAELKGSVEICGLDTQTNTIREIVQHAGLVLQNPSSQLFHLKVEDEIRFGPCNLGLEQNEVERRTDWALKAAGLESLRYENPSTLSGGQKQCVAIASILAMQPEVLILDEPTASLDVPSTRHVLDTLKILRSQYGVTVIIIEHRLAEVARMATRMILMDKGRIIIDGTPDSILSDGKIRNQYGFRRMTSETLVTWESLIMESEKPHDTLKPLLSFENVSAGYNRKSVINNINLSLYPGDFVAVVGNNGAGKSTLGLTAAGLLKPISGKVQFQDGSKPRPGLDVAMLFQNPVDQLFTDSVSDELAFGPKNYDRFNHAQHEEILRETGLSELKEHRPLLLSIGQEQRTALGACLGLRPRLLILDEPTLGQDWWHLQKLMDFLKRLNKQGMAILLISHDYKLVHHYAQKIYLMKSGEIQLTGHFVDHKHHHQNSSAIKEIGNIHETQYA